MSDGNRQFSPQRQGSLDRQRPEVTQIGEQVVAERKIQFYAQGRYAPDPVKESVQETSGATVTSDVSTATLDSGTQSGGDARLETLQNLAYVPPNVYETTRLIQAPDGVKDDQTLEWGLIRDDNGVFFRLTPNALELVIRDGFGGTVTDRTLASIDSSATKLDVDKARDPELAEKARIWGVRGVFYGRGKIVFFTRDTPKTDVRDPGEIETILGVYDPVQDPDLDDPTYTETINLPAAVRLQNNGTAPSSATSIKSGDTQIGVIGRSSQDFEPLFEREEDVSVADGDGQHLLMAIRPRTEFRGVDNDANIEINAIEFAVEGGTAPVRFWIERNITVDSGSFDDSQYTSTQSAYEVGLGQNFTDGDISIDRTDAFPVRPADYIAVDTKGGGAPSTADSSERLPIGSDEVIGLMVEAFGANATVNFTLEIDQGV